MAIIAGDSSEHFTTVAQALTKLANDTQPPTAGVGAFGAAGIVQGDRRWNFAATADFEFYICDKLVAQTGKWVEFRNVDEAPVLLQIRSDGSVGCYVGSGAASNPPNPLALFGTAPAGTVTFGIAHTFYFFVRRSGTGTGIVRVRVDGVQVLNVLGANQGDAPANLITNVRFFNNGTTNIANGTSSHPILANALGDIPGQPRMACRFATADGNYTAFTPVGAGADHKDRISETTPNDATHNDGAAPGDRDSYLYGGGTAIPAGSVILAVFPVPRVVKSDASVREVRSFYRETGTDHPGATKAVPASAGYLPDVWQLNLKTGNPFTPAEVNAPLEIGLEVVT